MEDPEQEISGVIHSLTQGTREEQEKALENYFLPNAYFVHPYCRVPSFESREIQVPFTSTKWTVNSRYLVMLVYQWYKILSPKISLIVDSTAFDKRTNSLYATIHQTFTIWLVPFSLWQANVKLVCLLKLVHLPADENGQPILSPDDEWSSVSPSRKQQKKQINNSNGSSKNNKKLYFIYGQEDHYQTNDALNFIAPFGSATLYYAWQIFATFLCALGVALLWPVTSYYERRTDTSAGTAAKRGRKNHTGKSR